MSPSARSKGEDRPRPIGEHLGELQARLLWVVVVTLAVFIGVLAFAPRILKEVTRPYRAAVEAVQEAGLEGASSLPLRPTSLQPADAFLVPIRVAFLAAIFVALPFILYQIWRFVVPGLKVRERAAAMPALAAGTGLFFGGGAIAWFGIVPLIMRICLRWSLKMGMTTIWTFSAIVSFELMLVIAFGIAFELPLVMFILARVGLLRPEHLRGRWKVVVLVAFIVGAFLTPPDVVSQIIMAGFLLGLYLAGAVLVRIGTKRAEVS